MAIEPNYHFWADKLRDLTDRLRHSSDDALDDESKPSKRVEEIEWCIQGLDGYCS